MSSIRRILITTLSVLGLILSFYLVYIYIKTSFMEGAPKSFCSITSFIDCDGVAKTSKAFFLGVPLAIWGVILYLLFLFLAHVDKIREKINFSLLNVFKNPLSYIASIGLFSFCISMILAFVSIFQIKKICILCFCTYIINLLIALFAVQKDIFITDIKNTVIDFFEGAKTHFILFIIVLILSLSFLTYTNVSMVLSPHLRANKSIAEFSKMKENIYAISGNTLGNPEGDVEIYIYADFQCPFCKIMNIMLHKLVKEDKGVVVYHNNFPLDRACNPIVRIEGHRGSCILAKYALAAKEQGNYWGMVSAIYNTIPQNEKKILQLGKSVGLNAQELYNDAHSDKIDEFLQNQILRGVNEGLNATPTIIIDGIPHTEIAAYDRLKQLVKQSRKRHAKSK